MQNEDTSLQSSPQLVESRDVVALSGKQILSLYKKSEQSGAPFDTLKEVYQRGYAIDFSEQTAYNRVNSFISGGAAAEMDKDLIEKRGLWDNIWAKRKRIAAGSGEHMRKPGSKGAPTKAALKASQTKEEVQEAKMRRSPWEKMASTLKKSTGKDLNAASNQAAQAHGELKQLHKDYQAIVDKDKVQKEETLDEIVVQKKMSKADKKKMQEYLAKHNKKIAAHDMNIKPPTKSFKALNRQSGDNSTSPSKMGIRHTLGVGYYKNEYNEEYTGAEKVSTNKNDPSNRFVGTDELTNNFKNATPGQSKISTVKKVVREKLEELSVPQGTTGHRKEWHPKTVGIRMASGKIQRRPPGKSGSSGSGGRGGSAGGSGGGTGGGGGSGGDGAGE